VHYKSVVRVIPPVLTDEEREKRIERIKSVAKELWISHLASELVKGGEPSVQTDRQSV
jgi:hypothetical protein